MEGKAAHSTGPRISRARANFVGPLAGSEAVRARSAKAGYDPQRPLAISALAARAPDGRPMSETESITLTITQESDYAFRVAFDETSLPPLLVGRVAAARRRHGPDPTRLLAAAIGNCLGASLLLRCASSRTSPARSSRACAPITHATRAGACASAQSRSRSRCRTRGRIRADRPHPRAVRAVLHGHRKRARRHAGRGHGQGRRRRRAARVG